VIFIIAQKLGSNSSTKQTGNASAIEITGKSGRIWNPRTP
jgi:hypothetical protein